MTRWVDEHPGGQLPLLNVAGGDATDAFQAFHPGWVAKRLAAFEVGVAAPAAHALAAGADEAFRALKAQLEQEGLFRPTPWFYAREARCLRAAQALRSN